MLEGMKNNVKIDKNKIPQAKVQILIPQIIEQ